MIYDMVNDALAALITRWDELETAFKQLAEALADGSAEQETLVKEDAADPGLIQLCAAERTRLDGQILPLSRKRPALELFREAIKQFTQSDHQADVVQVGFDLGFGLAADDESAEETVARNQIERLRRFVSDSLQEFEEITSVQGERFNVKGIRGSVENLAAYPILTSEVSGSLPAPPTAASGGGGVISLQRTVETALREVLGRVPKRQDTRSFVVALNQSFQLETVEGHTVVSWSPRSYAGQTDLGGGVTGGQASLYARARVALDNALPLLEGLYPLLPDVDEELSTAARAIVRSDLTEVVAELGVEGGPRVARVERLFDSLLDQETLGPFGGDGGHLGYLQRVFGLTPEQVNTLDEETDVTNYTILRDYVKSLRDSWNVFREDSLGKDLGTRLVLLSRALSVAAEAVGEVYAAMDSVFVGAAERQVASFRDQDNRQILVEEMFSWIISFTSEEAPRLIYEGGRRGVAAIVPTAQLLEQLVTRFIQAIPHEPTLPVGLRHPRVRHPLSELRAYLERVQQLAQDVRR